MTLSLILPMIYLLLRHLLLSLIRIGSSVPANGSLIDFYTSDTLPTVAAFCKQADEQLFLSIRAYFNNEQEPFLSSGPSCMLTDHVADEVRRFKILFHLLGHSTFQRF